MSYPMYLTETLESRGSMLVENRTESWNSDRSAENPVKSTKAGGLQLFQLTDEKKTFPGKYFARSKCKVVQIFGKTYFPPLNFCSVQPK